MKKKKKKGSLELSVNSIVILIMAIALLGLGLGFIKTKFSDLNRQLIIDEPSPPSASSSEPITLSKDKIAASAGKTVALKIKVYNFKPGTGPISIVPSITCTGITFESGAIQFNSKQLSQGEQAEFASVIKIPKISAGTYLCSVSVAALPAQKDLIIDIQ